VLARDAVGNILRNGAGYTLKPGTLIKVDPPDRRRAGERLSPRRIKGLVLRARLVRRPEGEAAFSTGKQWPRSALGLLRHV